MGQSRPLFVYFRYFHIPIKWQIYNLNNLNWKKNIDGVLGTRTRRRKMESADESTELWRHPYILLIFVCLLMTTSCQNTSKYSRAYFLLLVLGIRVLRSYRFLPTWSQKILHLSAGHSRIHRRVHLPADAEQGDEPAAQRRDVPQADRRLGLTWWRRRWWKK